MAFRSSRYGWLILAVAGVGFFIFIKSLPRDIPATLGSHDRRETAGGTVVVTMAHYELISKGMTYETVRNLIGADGVELSRSDLAGHTTVMYAWKNRNGSNMNAMFQDGALVMKAQFGLP
jgi:hypothetical protein